MIRYLIFVILGILLFVFLNHKDGFSIGIPYIINNPEGHPLDGDIANRLFDTQQEAMRTINENDELRQLYEDKIIDIKEISCPTPEAVSPERLDIVENTKIAKLYTDVCSRVNEMFLKQDESVRRDITKKIVEAILAFIGESDESIQIIKGMQFSTLIDLPDVCAALVIQCLDIPETNDIPLDILLDLLDLLFHYLLEKESFGMETIIELLFQTQTDPAEPNQIEAPLIYVIIQFTQDLYYFPQVFRRVVEIDEEFIKFLWDNWIDVYGSYEVEGARTTIWNEVVYSGINFPIPNSIHTYYQFLWIYINRNSPDMEFLIGSSIDFSLAFYYYISEGGDSFQKFIEDIYGELHGPDFCGDSGD